MLIAFHKPYGVLSQFTPDGSPHRTLADFGFPKNVYPIGRLDAESEGLMLLSEEAGMNERLLHPRHAHEREYWAEIERIPTREALQMLSRGLELQGKKTLPCRAWILEPQPEVQAGLSSPDPAATLKIEHTAHTAGSQPSQSRERQPLIPRVAAESRAGSEPAAPFASLLPRNPPIRFRKNVPICWLGLELIEGKNRQVRRMTAAIGHPTLRLIRVRIGGFWLGDLAPGQWKELSPGERAAILA